MEAPLKGGASFLRFSPGKGGGMVVLAITGNWMGVKWWLQRGYSSLVLIRGDGRR